MLSKFKIEKKIELRESNKSVSNEPLKCQYHLPFYGLVQYSNG